MIVADMPFEPFWAFLRKAAKELDFHFLALFIAREADCQWAFDRLERDWASIHDVTGSKIIFVTFDGEDHTPIAGWGNGCELKENVGTIKGNDGLTAFSRYFKINKDLDVSRVNLTEDSFYPKGELTSEEFVNEHLQPRSRSKGWKDEQSLGISSVLNVLENITESDVPCLYLELLNYEYRSIIPIPTEQIEGFSFYKSFKQLIDDESLLYRIQGNSESIAEFSIDEKSLLKRQKKSLESCNWLENWVKTQDDLSSEIYDFIQRSLEGNAKTEEVFKQISPLRSKLEPSDFSNLRAHLNRLAATPQKYILTGQRKSALENQIEKAIHLLKQKVNRIFIDFYQPKNNLMNEHLESYKESLRNNMDKLSIHKNSNSQEDSFDNGYALIIGVANYPKVSKLPKEVLKDAEDIYSVITSSEYCGYNTNNVEKLIDDEATSREIRKGLCWLAEKAKEGDTVIIFFSGHGGESEVIDEDGNYLIPYDCDPKDIPSTAISGDKLTNYFRKIKAKRLLVIFDCCYAGGTGIPKNGLLDLEDPFLKAFKDTTYQKFASDKLAEGKGRAIIASSRSDQVSLILRGMDNSLFTHHLLEGFRGKTKNNGEGVIKVSELFDYVSEKVPASANQNPVFKAHYENSFPIALWCGGQKSLEVGSLENIETSSYRAGELRRLTKESLTQDEILDLCQDYFPKIYDDVASDGLKKSQSVRILIDYVSRNSKRIEKLIEEIKKQNSDA